MPLRHILEYTPHRAVSIISGMFRYVGDVWRMNRLERMVNLSGSRARSYRDSGRLR